MQNAKDSFYIALRDRLAVVNPARTITVRAVQRPGVLMEEAESLMATLPSDVFVLRWTTFSRVELTPCALYSAGCEVHYATSGSDSHSGLDRGRAMAAMDRELALILKPMSVVTRSFTSTPPVTLPTNAFWTDPEFSGLTAHANQLKRVVSLTIFALADAEVA